MKTLHRKDAINRRLYNNKSHDIFHILLDFDTTYMGKIGVLAFATTQNYSKSLQIGLWIAK